jgi:hypothetical protein
VENVKTVPIHVSKARSPRLLRSQLRRYVHAAVASAAGVILPASTTYGFVIWYGRNHALFGSGAATGILLLCLVVPMMHTIARCSMRSMLVGLGAVAISAFLPAVIDAASIVVGVTVWIGLTVAHVVYRSLRSGVSHPDAYGTPDELNPRCSTCHARSFCPYQPGGIAERYTSNS